MEKEVRLVHLARKASLDKKEIAVSAVRWACLVFRANVENKVPRVTVDRWAQVVHKAGPVYLDSKARRVTSDRWAPLDRLDLEESQVLAVPPDCQVQEALLANLEERENPAIVVTRAIAEILVQRVMLGSLADKVQQDPQDCLAHAVRKVRLA